MKYFKIIKYKLLANKIINKNIDKKDRIKLGDRDVLERIIFPYVLAHFNPQKILDVGREDYQHFYNEFFKNRELWTLDIDPERKEFGAENHIVDNASNIGAHFKENYFDFILMNGVVGWGLNDIEKINKSIAGVHKILKPGGLFVLGWNDFQDIKVTKPSDIEALNEFSKYAFKPLNAHEYKTKTGEHTYNFFTKN